MENLMADSNYVRDYFSNYASEWLANAYNLEEFPAIYPTGLNRVRITLEIITDQINSKKGHILDLGCGGGDLCFEAARIGFHATGIDIAEGMIKKARAVQETLSPDVSGKVDFSVGDALSTRLPDGKFDAIVGMGLIEYLPADSILLKEAYRLLKPVGQFILSCRNRLLNLSSFNKYTQNELNSKSAILLIDEAIERSNEVLTQKMMRTFLFSLKKAIPNLENALHMDFQGNESPIQKPTFNDTRRQHTPNDIWHSAKDIGFENPSFRGVHPHPFPPRYKSVAPRFFTQFARVYEVFESQPISLLWSSAFIATFTKPEG